MAKNTYPTPMRPWTSLAVITICMVLLLVPYHPVEGKLVTRLEFEVVSYEIRSLNSTHADFGLILNVSNTGAVSVTIYKAYFYAIDHAINYYKTTTKGSFILLEGKSKVFTLNFTMPKGTIPENFTYRSPDESKEYVFPLIPRDQDGGGEDGINVWDMIMIAFLGLIFILAMVAIYFATSRFKKGQRKIIYLK
jgi:hypothetical protein